MKNTAFQRVLVTLPFVALVTLLSACSNVSLNSPQQPPAGFENLEDFFQGAGLQVQTDVRYFSSDNFVGAPVDGYLKPKIFITLEAAAALLRVQRQLRSQGLGLKVFDAYRPQQAVDHFVRWAEDLMDVRMKQKYYPNVDKQHLFRDGYIAARSGHSRGSTVDLTLITLSDGIELDMGTTWDFFDPLSWPASTGVSAEQKANRDLLRGAMLAAGFKPLAEEWWHFTLSPEPYPDHYFDFDIR
ncbi:MAG: D-alanyl-D-alanine dipeptidase [Pseudohongiellaceae bacterium]|jgi:D-alanyl-D-alanine dipeptidase